MCAAELGVLRYNQASHNRVKVGLCICSSWFWPVQDVAHFVLLLPSYDVLWTHDHDGFWATKLAANCLCRVERFSAKDVFASLRDFYKPYKHNWHEWQLGSVSTGSVSKYMWANKISASGHKNWLQRLVLEHTLQTTCLHVILQLLSGSRAAL